MINIRSFRINDGIEVAKIKAQAFGSKLGKIIQWDKKLLEEMVLYNLESHRNSKMFVAEEEGKILGFINLFSKKYIDKQKKSNLLRCISKFGIINTFRFWFASVIIEFNSISRGECYINQIAVASEGRGKGVGSKLLEKGEDECFKQNRDKKYTLNVMKENVKAHKLYLSKGFCDSYEIRFPLFKTLTGFSSAIHMEKRVQGC